LSCREGKKAVVQNGIGGGGGQRKIESRKKRNFEVYATGRRESQPYCGLGARPGKTKERGE